MIFWKSWFACDYTTRGSLKWLSCKKIKGTFIWTAYMLQTWNLDCTFLIWSSTNLIWRFWKFWILAFLWLEKCQKIQYGRHFWQFSSHKMAKIQNFQNRQIRFVELHVRKLLSNFQVASMYAAQMNVPFILYKLSRFKVFRVV